jgi:hypothetical protein
MRQMRGSGPAWLPRDEGRPPYDPEAAFICNRPAAQVLGYSTACHAGHLDIARELLDGTTNVGLR